MSAEKLLKMQQKGVITKARNLFWQLKHNTAKLKIKEFAAFINQALTLLLASIKVA